MRGEEADIWERGNTGLDGYCYRWQGGESWLAGFKNLIDWFLGSEKSIMYSYTTVIHSCLSITDDICSACVYKQACSNCSAHTVCQSARANKDKQPRGLLRVTRATACACKHVNSRAGPHWPANSYINANHYTLVLESAIAYHTLICMLYKCHRSISRALKP